MGQGGTAAQTRDEQHVQLYPGDEQETKINRLHLHINSGCNMFHLRLHVFANARVQNAQIRPLVFTRKHIYNAQFLLLIRTMEPYQKLILFRQDSVHIDLSCDSNHDALLCNGSGEYNSYDSCGICPNLCLDLLRCFLYTWWNCGAVLFQLLLVECVLSCDERLLQVLRNI